LWGSFESCGRFASGLALLCICRIAVAFFSYRQTIARFLTWRFHASEASAFVAMDSLFGAGTLPCSSAARRS
jgi:hypothetical protein